MISAYRLKKLTGTGCFPVYSNQEREIALTLSGNGKTSAAAACMNLACMLSAAPEDPWINIGIAGHATREIGEAVIVDRVIDAGSDECWYPQLTFPLQHSTDTCLTVDRARAEYPDCLTDMEASGLFTAAVRLTSLELIHSLKVVSDNRAHPHTRLNRAKATDLIENALPVLESLLEALRRMRRELSECAVYRELLPSFLEQWHFTKTQTHMLEHLLKRWQCLCPGQDPASQYRSRTTATSVLAAMQADLDSIPVDLSAGKP